MMAIKTMHRTQIQLDRETYQALRRLAFERGQSLSATIRELLRQALGITRPSPRKIEQFTFIGAFASGEPNRISEEHDKPLGEQQW